MAHNYQFARVENTDPRSVADKYSFPDGACAIELLHPGAGMTQADGPTEHATTLEIWGDAAPSTNYDNAPNGSKYYDVTNAAWYIKTGMPGSGIDGTFTKHS